MLWLGHVFIKGNHSIPKTALKWTQTEGIKVLKVLLGVERKKNHV